MQQNDYIGKGCAQVASYVTLIRKFSSLKNFKERNGPQTGIILILRTIIVHIVPGDGNKCDPDMD